MKKVGFLSIMTAAASIASSNPLPIPFRVDCGNTSSFTDAAGNVWNADTCSVGGTSINRLTDPTNTLGGTQSFEIKGVTNGDSIVFQTEHYDLTNFVFYNVPNGTYKVVLLFCETRAAPLYPGPHIRSGTGQRVFNVSINGSTVLPNFDIWEKAGGPFIAIYDTFAVTVTADSINIGFAAVTQSTLINGIEILPEKTGILPVEFSRGLDPAIDKCNDVFAKAPGKSYSLLGRAVSLGARQPLGLFIVNTVRAPKLVHFK